MAVSVFFCMSVGTRTPEARGFPRERVNRRRAAGGGSSEAVKRSGQNLERERNKFWEPQEGGAIRVSLPLPYKKPVTIVVTGFFCVFTQKKL